MHSEKDEQQQCPRARGRRIEASGLGGWLGPGTEALGGHGLKKLIFPLLSRISASADHTGEYAEILETE